MEKTRHDSAVSIQMPLRLIDTEISLALIRLSAPSPICKNKREKADKFEIHTPSAFARALLGVGEGADRRMRAPDVH